MFNPQDHPGSPPPPSPTNSSSSTPPSESPKPRFRRQKMLAQKTVASGALRKVLNERLKASQVKNSPAPNSDSSSGFVLVGPIRDVKLVETSRSGGKKKSEKEKEREGACGEEKGNGKGAVLAICGVAQEMLEESDMKSGEIGTSYDPKKCKATTPKAPNVANPSKKRKTSSPKPTASSMPKGRATRSRVKQSEADLQKALEESKKRKMEKGKGKVNESSEGVEEEEMELIHQERGTIVEASTPKHKKSKTSSKKSSSVPVSDVPSLAKRTRSVVKTKQAKVSDDEEWSGK
ncbi:uncharacterized protein [Nicotiana sylvestris]|uniref:uncharacterized protein n=1 Tax=Nicotiana sylvestris TaxID=4096 RepID=UPI00388C83E0